MKVMLINGLEMRKIKEGDILQCLTDEEPPFDKVKTGDKCKVIYINPFNEVLVEWRHECSDFYNLGDLLLNFDKIW